MRLFASLRHIDIVLSIFDLRLVLFGLAKGRDPTRFLNCPDDLITSNPDGDIFRALTISLLPFIILLGSLIALNSGSVNYILGSLMTSMIGLGLLSRSI